VAPAARPADPIGPGWSYRDGAPGGNKAAGRPGDPYAELASSPLGERKVATGRLAHPANGGSIGIVTKRHPVGALILALIPALALVAGLPFVNRVDPTVLGLPFLLAWILGWVLVTPLFLAGAYVLAQPKDGGAGGGADR